MELDDDHHMSIIAERPPTPIDDAFKATKAMAYREVVKNLDLVKLYNWLSNAYPMDKEYVDTVGVNSMRQILGVSRYPIREWEKNSREYMSVSSWIRFAYFIAAGHDSVVMKELREIAFAIEDDNPAQQTYKGNLSKEKLLKKAYEKLVNGTPIPETKEAVDQLGKHIAIHTVTTA